MTCRDVIFFTRKCSTRARPACPLYQKFESFRLVVHMTAKYRALCSGMGCHRNSCTGRPILCPGPLYSYSLLASLVTHQNSCISTSMFYYANLFEHFSCWTTYHLAAISTISSRGPHDGDRREGLPVRNTCSTSAVHINKIPCVMDREKISYLANLTACCQVTTAVDSDTRNGQ